MYIATTVDDRVLITRKVRNRPSNVVLEVYQSMDDMLPEARLEMTPPEAQELVKGLQEYVSNV